MVGNPDAIVDVLVVSWLSGAVRFIGAVQRHTRLPYAKVAVRLCAPDYLIFI